MGKILAVCSGSGGVGKSTVALSVALAAAECGKQTILLDASGIARSCDLSLGLESVVVLDLLDVAKQQIPLDAVLYAVPGKTNLRFACASLYEGTPIHQISSVLLAMRTKCELLVLDLPTGIAAMPEELMGIDDVYLMVTRPDDASIRSLGRLIGNMYSGCERPQRYLLINRMNAALIKRKLQYTKEAVEMILDMPADLCMMEDEGVQRGVIFSGKSKHELIRWIKRVQL